MEDRPPQEADRAMANDTHDNAQTDRAMLERSMAYKAARDLIGDSVTENPEYARGIAELLAEMYEMRPGEMMEQATARACASLGIEPENLYAKWNG